MHNTAPIGRATWLASNGLLNSEVHVCSGPNTLYSVSFRHMVRREGGRGEGAKLTERIAGHRKRQ